MCQLSVERATGSLRHLKLISGTEIIFRRWCRHNKIQLTAHKLINILE